MIHTQSRKRCDHIVFTLLILFALTLALPAQTPVFSKSSQSGRAGHWHADFNGDGREDFIAPAPGGLTVQLSNGSGTYNAPKFFALSSGKAMVDATIGKFCCAGDFVAIDAQTPHLFFFAGNSAGAFTETTMPTRNGDIPLNVVAGDFNHDGHMDIAYIAQNRSGQSFIQVLFGPVASGSFSVGPMSLVPDFQPGRAMYVGDFDGDGKADLMTCDFAIQAANPMFVHYGDGHGDFPESVEVSGNGGGCGRVFDLNGDAKSDIIFHPFDFGSAQGDILVKEIDVFYGNAARTWSETRIPTSRFVMDDSNTAVADFNGDGIPDLAFTEASSSSGAFPHFLVVMTGKGGGAFNSETTVATLNSIEPGFFGFSVLDTLRSVRLNKPDLAIDVCNTSSCASFTLFSFLNSTSGAFPSCLAPSGFTGINVCGPAPGSTTSSTTVGFHIGAVGQTNMRKVEVWVDGHKLGEQFAHAFSKYAFFDRSFTLAVGTHSVTVFAAGWDNWLEKTSFSIKVP